MTTEVLKISDERIAKSSQILLANYDPAKQELAIRFRGSPKKLYVYSAVPKTLWDELDQAESIGSFVYRRVTKPKDDGSKQFEFICITDRTPDAAA
jgi:hypothetical protein